MSTRTLIMGGLTIGSIFGSLVPVLFGADEFSYSSVIGSTIGSIIGVYIGWKLAHL